MLVSTSQTDGIKVRLIKKKRTQHTDEFYHGICISELGIDDGLDADYNDLVDSTVAPIPRFRKAHCALKNNIIISLTIVNSFN